MGNTVGSLTQQQRDLIIGCVLGDGYIRQLEGRKDAFLEINHSIKAKDYVDWKYEILKNICQSPPKQRIIDAIRTAYRFFTCQNEEISKIHRLFYQKGVKIIPKGLVLNPFILAVWYMDDGSKTSKNDVYLNSQQFKMLEQKRLLYALRKIGISGRINKDKKYYRIRIHKESIPDFVRIIRPIIVPSMNYKIAGL